MVVDRGRAVLRRLEADRRGDAGRGLGGVAVAPGAVVAHRTLFGARPLAHRLELGGRAIAVIGASGGEQLPRHLGMPLGASELMDDFAVPFEPKPFEAVDDCRHRLGGRSHPVGVFDAQPKHPAVMAGKQPVEQSGAGAADMQKPGRRRRKTDGDGHAPRMGKVLYDINAGMRGDGRPYDLRPPERGRLCSALVTPAKGL